MTGHESDPLDVHDEVILTELRRVAAHIDPMPAGLPDAVKFALAVRMLHAEAAAITQDCALAVRAVTSAERPTVSFSSRTVDLLISASDSPDGSLRIDGWVTPAGMRIEVYADPIPHRLTDGRPVASVDSDDLGRFVLTALQIRRMLFVVRPLAAGQAPTVTPIVEF